MKVRCKYKECNVLFESYWGPGSIWNRRLYCSPGCRSAVKREAQRLYAKKRRGYINSVKLQRDRKISGRQCQWEHCQVDDENHIGNWNSPARTCPSCYRQALRVGSCTQCDGPLYHQPGGKPTYCPTCDPLYPKAGEVSLTLVCSATGREHQIVRKLSWKLPDGTPLSKVQDGGFAVVDLEPNIWAGFRT